jgi:hypothetical protein
MRFETKFDRWQLVVLIVAAIVTCVVMPLNRLLAPGTHPDPLWLSFLPLFLWLIILPCTLPQYYVLQGDGLFLRKGWKKSLVPYASLVDVQCNSDSRSAGVFSTDRILLATQEGKRYLIAVAEEERFLDELSKRCPQLSRKPFGLAVSMFSNY